MHPTSLIRIHRSNDGEFVIDDPDLGMNVCVSFKALLKRQGVPLGLKREDPDLVRVLLVRSERPQESPATRVHERDVAELPMREQDREVLDVWKRRDESLGHCRRSSKILTLRVDEFPRVANGVTNHPGR